MDFHGMKRKDLQSLCKKTGIPGNLKNIEMATRLASLFEETVNLPEDSVEADGIKDDLVVSKEAKRVRFSPENEVFVFTPSVKKCLRKNVRMGHAQDLQQGGIELRRSKRFVAKGITIASPNTRRGGLSNVQKSLEVPRRSKRIGSTGSTQVTELLALEQFEFEDISQGLGKIGKRSRRLKGYLLESSVGGGTLKARTLLPAKRSQRLVDTQNKKDELVQTNVKDLSMDVQDDPKVEKDIDVQANTQDRRRSIRLEARAPNSSMGGETSEGRPLCSAKDSMKDTKSKQSKGSTVVMSLVGNEPLLDCEVQTTENYARMKLQDVSIVEKVPRRPKRCRKDINVLMDKRPVKAPIVVEEKQDRSAEPGIDNETTSTHGNPTPKELLDQFAQFEQEEAGGTNVESGSSFKKQMAMNQECVKDMPQGMIENSPSSSEAKATESVMVIDNVLDSSPEKSVDSSQRTNTQELDSELMEGKREEKLERDTNLMPVIEEEKEDVSSCSIRLIERLSPASVQLVVSNPEAERAVATSHNHSKDIASIATKTRETTFICTPRSELKECSSVAKLAKEQAIMESSIECWKEIHQRKDDEKCSLEKEVGATLHGKFFEYNTENNSAEEKMEITKAGDVNVGHCVNLTPEKLLDEYTQLASEEAGGANVEARGSSKKVKTVNQECVKDKPQGMAEEDSASLSETKATEPVMISENVLDSTMKSSVDISSRANTQDLSSELVEEKREEKHEQDTVLVAAMKDKEEASSLSVCLIEHSKVSNPEVELFVETTPPLVSSQLAVSNHEVELGVSTACILVKDIASTVIANEDFKTKEEILIFIPRSELKDHSFVAKLAETEEILEKSGECWNENHSSKDNEKDSLAKKIQEENLHGNFSEYNTENSKAGKEKGDTATNFPDESDAPNTTERCSMLEGSRQTEAKNEGESKVIELHDESDIATSLVTKFSVKNFKEDRFGRNEENRTTELQHESGTCTSLETHELFGSFGQKKARESEQIYMESGLSTGLHRDQPLADSELGKAGWLEINSADKYGLFTSLETQLVSGDMEQKKAVKTGEKADEKFCVASYVPNITERQPFTENSELDEAAKSEEDKAVELQVDCGIFTSAEKHLLLETDEEMIANSHDGHEVFIAFESQSHMGEFEPREAEKTNRENMNVDLLGESNTYNNPESHLLFRDSGVHETKKIKDHTAATCEESFVFTSPERQKILVNSEVHNDGKEERNEVEVKDEPAFFCRLESGLVLGESGLAGLDIGKSYLSQYQSHHSSSLKFDFRENIIADSSGSMESKVSYNYEFNVGQETAGAELMKKGSQAEDVDSLDATQGISKENSEHSPHADLVNLFDNNIEEAETMVEAERNVLGGSYILALPIEGDSSTVGEISSYLEVIGTCSMVSEESGPSTDVQNQIHDAMEELALTDNTEVDEVIEAKVTQTSKESYEGNVLLNSSGGSYVSKNTCVLAGAESGHLSLNSEVDFRNTCEKIVPNFLKDEAPDSIATAFEKAISLTSNELTVQNNMNEEAADEEMIRRETTPSPEKTLHESSKMEYLNIDESSKQAEKQVRREPILVYRTQVKLKRNDMKENAPNSKIVDNLNVTAPRTSKRQPLQDLGKK